MTYAYSPPNDWPLMVLPSMQSAAAFPARTSVTRDVAPALTATDRDCGLNTHVSLANYDRDTSSWKTSQHSLFGGLSEFSEPWPRSGMTRSGTAYPLPPLAPLTGETGFGLSRWPTRQQRYRRRTSVAMLPTQSRDRAENSSEVLNYDTNKSVSFDDCSRMWPTPHGFSHGRAEQWTSEALAKAPVGGFRTWKRS